MVPMSTEIVLPLQRQGTPEWWDNPPPRGELCIITGRNPDRYLDTGLWHESTGNIIIDGDYIIDQGRQHDLTNPDAERIRTLEEENEKLREQLADTKHAVELLSQFSKHEGGQATADVLPPRTLKKMNQDTCRAILPHLSYEYKKALLDVLDKPTLRMMIRESM